MKLTTLLLIVSLFKIQANSYSQNTKITLKLNNVTIEEVFNKIESLSEFHFLYNPEEVGANRTVSVNVRKKLISEILETLFLDTNISFVVKKKQIILNIGDVLNLFSIEKIQQKEISGVVTDGNGIPLPGVNISIKNTNNGTQTDFNGKYTLNVSIEDVIIFSYVGMNSVEKTVGTSNTINIVMEENDEALEEVIVTAYGTSKKNSFTGSAQTVTTEVITKGSTASFETALQGNLSGVNISTSGQPEGKSSVQIRGIGSINGSTQPLYVLDGVVINTDATLRAGDNRTGAVAYNPLSTINSEDIKSISVLKDAAAASLYGSRAANGVIIITTKKGQSGETQLSFGVLTGLTQNLTQEKAINNQQFKELWKEGQVNQYIQNSENSEFNRVYGNNTLFTNYQNLATSDYESIYGSTNANSDWLGAIYQTGTLKKYNLSARGGNDKISFYISGDYFDQKGTIIGAYLKRYSGRVNLENQAKEWLKLGLNLSLAKTERSAALYDGTYAGGLNPLYMARVLPPAAPIYDPNGYEGYANLPNDIEKNANPIGIINVGEYINKEFRNRGSFFAEFKLAESLKFRTTLGIDQQAIDETLYDNKEFGAGGGRWNGVLHRVKSEAFQATSSNVLNYNKDFKNHGVHVLAGFEVQESKMNSVSVYGYDILDSNLLSSSSIGTPWVWDGFSENYSLISYFLGVNYNYNQKYFLSASFRRDGSSRFGADSRWGDFWSVSGSWIISEEDFFEGKMIDRLKLRASYGTNGNLPSDYYAHLAIFNTGKSYGNNSGISYAQLQNKDLSWELSKNLNVGIDAKLFENLNLTVEYFSKKTEDLLLQVPISAVSGFNSQLQNFGAMTNSGWEFELGYTPISKDKFYWNTKANITLLSNEITKLKNDIVSSYSSRYGQDPLVYKEGESIYSFYLRDYAGVDKTNGKAQYFVLDENGSRTGTTTTDASETGFGVFGNALQNFQGGLLNQFTYNDFTLDFLFTFGLGGNVYDRTAFKRDDDGFSPQFTNTTTQLSPWNPNNTTSDVPIRINGNTSFSNDVSTRHLYSADYLKFKNIKLSYKLPSEWKVIDGGNVYIQGDNLFLITALNDYDPEAVANGVNFFQIPTARSIMLGVQLNF